MDSLKTQINKDLINIVRSYLTISEVKVNRNRKLMIYNIEKFVIPQDENIKTCKLIYKYKGLKCGYCVNCDNPGYHYPNYSSKKFKIIFNKKPICDECYNAYCSKTNNITESILNAQFFT